MFIKLYGWHSLLISLLPSTSVVAAVFGGGPVDTFVAIALIPLSPANIRVLFFGYSANNLLPLLIKLVTSFFDFIGFDFQLKLLSSVCVFIVSV